MYWCRVDCVLLICVMVQGRQISLELLLVPIVLVQGELLIILIILCTDAEWTAPYCTVYWYRVDCSLLYCVLVQGGLLPTVLCTDAEWTASYFTVYW